MPDIRIALVIKTDGLEFDDRVRKEVLTIQSLYPNISFKIFAMLPDNLEQEGITMYGVPYKAIYITARDKYPSSKKKMLKGYQFYKAVEKDVKEYDAVWAANVDAVFIPLLLHHKRILWDLHELPLDFLGKPFRPLLRYLFNRCRVVLHANTQRADYLQSIGVIANRSKHIALRNYPIFDDVDQDRDDTFWDFLKWKGTQDCVYLQGLAEDRRSAYESIAAVLKQGNLLAVVVGKMHQESLNRLKRDFGETLLHERVLFVGKIAQLKIPQFVETCKISLVFYKNVQPNNWFCEANRFYQSVILGIPVVVGNNPSMREFIEQYGFGISIDDDGRNVDMIIEGINQVLDNYDYYHQNTLKHRDKIVWRNQDDVIKQIVNKLLN